MSNMINNIFTEYRSKFVYVFLLIVLYFCGAHIALMMCVWVLFTTIIGKFKQFDRGFLILVHGMVTFCIHSISYDSIPSFSVFRTYSDQLFLIYMFSIFVVDTCPRRDMRYGLSILIWIFGCLLHPAVLCEHSNFQHSVWSYGIATTLVSLLVGCTPLMSRMKVWEICTQMSWLYICDWYSIINANQTEFQIWIFALVVFHLATMYIKNLLWIDPKSSVLPVENKSK